MILASFREVFRAGTAKGFMILVKYILHKAGVLTTRALMIKRKGTTRSSVLPLVFAKALCRP